MRERPTGEVLPASEEARKRFTVADAARLPRLGMSVPERLRFLPDGRLAYVLPQKETGVSALWAFDPRTGDHALLFDPSHAPGAADPAGEPTDDPLEVELRAQRTRSPLGGVRESVASVDRLCVATEAGLFVGRLRETPPTWRLVPDTRGAMHPNLTADGRFLAFVRSGDLYRWDGNGPDVAPSRLTPEHEPWVTYATAEYIAQEELGRDYGYVLSPDGRQALVTRVESGHIPILPIVHEAAVPAPWTEEHRYPFAGGPNAHVELFILPFLPKGASRTDSETGSELRALDIGLAGDDYLARFSWTEDGRVLVVTLNREQTRMRYLVADPLGRRGPVTLWEEQSDTWLNLPGPQDSRVMRDGSLVTTSETLHPAGYRHLVQVHPGGRVEPLTHGDWEITQVLGVFEAPSPREKAEGAVPAQSRAGVQTGTNGFALFLGTAEGPLERHVYRTDLDKGTLRQLTPEPGVHAGTADAEGLLLADQFSSLERAPVTCIRSLEDGKILHVVHEDPDMTPTALSLVPPKVVRVPGVDGEVLYGALYPPRYGGRTEQPTAGPEEEALVPAVISVYGGPHAQRVLNDWSLTVDLEAQILAQEGALVFKLDNRGSAHRGHAFETPLFLGLGEAELEDQVRGVRHLIEEHRVDPKRVGIFGWSFGGYMALRALTRAPEVFSVGVAGAPVTDFRWYDTAYTERYLRTPEKNPEGYESSAIFGDLARLTAPLLLIHGLTDENVHFRHTARLVTELVRLHRSFEILPLPENRHMLRDFDHRFVRTARTLRFLAEHLGLRDPEEGLGIGDEPEEARAVARRALS